MNVMYFIIAAVTELTPMNKDNVLKSLEIMWKGVLAIFITIVIIMAVSIAINVISNKAKLAVDKKRAELEAKKIEDNSDGQNKTE